MDHDPDRDAQAERTAGADQSAWTEKVALAEAMLPLVGRLHREKGIVPTVHGRSLVGKSVVGIIKTHRFARRVDDVELPLQTSLEILRVLSGLDLAPAAVDVARLGADGDGDLGQRVRAALAPLLGRRAAAPNSRDVVLYGFGRIGRLLARILLERGEDPSGLRLRAIVVRRGGSNDLVKRASLLRRDSVHGAFAGTITVDEERERIIANGTAVQVIYSDDPAAVDYTAHGISDALVIDNTGRWRDAEGLSRHLGSRGVGRVLLTAPGKGDIRNVVHGLNEGAIGPDEQIVSAASCTTNAISPVLKVLHDRYGIQHGHVETVHSFTNDQNLIDNFHKGDRRGRSAVLNMVVTETGAAKAVAKALPELAGRLTGNSIRVPTPNVSLAILNLTLERGVDKAELNDYLRRVSLSSPLQDQVDFVDSPEVVSTDFVGTRKTGVVDGLATIADGSRHVVVYVWYDNERGYSEQVLRVAETMLGVARPVVPPLTWPAVPGPRGECVPAQGKPEPAGI
ncbi:glyceraldehyde 3-phosphate dehydrogenase [Kineococcus xinjiangensis]|uniref:Glyceraldehyde 3-phosphate dehydrogenase n=1 Tax=Kineococcus xinjiangensis TaxID=512762 RepID=A0A2S6IUU8_9ACTN|nr:glyceraldehyde-3-phosphate dehydrogenase [Kineococcus xinjiangensis]PPK98052.1 glyceraldehyde 3-phosphate dehydrogenase [Kineococcus xinjiangensis]